jgi:hypothetical protein
MYVFKPNVGGIMVYVKLILLLRGHVLRRPHEDSLAGRVRRRGHGSVYRSRTAAQLGDAEVEQLGALPGEHDVGGLQVAVNDPLMVGLGERLGNLGRIAQRFLQRQGPPSQPRSCSRPPGTP